jgi:hypothetical protein
LTESKGNKEERLQGVLAEDASRSSIMSRHPKLKLGIGASGRIAIGSL